MSDVRIVPEPGMGATLQLWSDRHAYTVVEVTSPTRLVAVRDRAYVVKGNIFDGSAEYRYEPGRPDMRTVFTRRRNGRWVQVGEPQTGAFLVLGDRAEYRDPHF